MRRILPWIVTLAAGIAIWVTPAPVGVSREAWNLLAVFIATIVGIISKPLPMGTVAILGITASVLTGCVSIDVGLSGFGNRVIWLIVIAFFISRGFVTTGLGARIAYFFMRLLGRRTLGLAYGLVAADLVLAPAIPSNTARAGGIIFPVLRSIAGVYGSDPEKGTERRIGGFLIACSFQGTVITSGMFLTAMAANPLAANLAREVGVEVSWSLWALAAIVPGVISLILVPWILFKIYPPEIKSTPEARQLAVKALEKMGSMNRGEWIMFSTFILLLVLWISGRVLSIHSTTTGLLGLSILLLTKTLTWNDILAEKGAWNTLIWFSALVMMATQLNALGLIPWFSGIVGQLLNGVHWLPAFLVLSLIYFYSHYFFASNTAHVSAFYLPFLTLAISVNTPPMLAALVLGFFSNLIGGLTHYGTGPAPVLFGSGYVSMKDWWTIGGKISVVNIAIWIGFGGLWWKIIGLW